MASVAGIPVTTMQGRLVEASRPYRLSTQTAVDGADVLFDGWQTEPQQITTIMDEANDPRDLEDIFRALINGTATIVDQLGRRWEQVRVLDVVSHTARTAAGRWQLSTVWTLLPLAREPGR